MLAKSLISNEIPFLRTSDLGVDALNWMEIYRISHLPIINDEDFLGLISDADIYDLNMANEPIGNHNLSLIRPFINETQHIYDAYSLASKLKLSVVPVLTKKNKYMGVISLLDLVHSIANITGAANPGSLIVLEQSIHDYSLAEIAQIIESNDAKILSCYTNTSTYSTLVEIILKINKIDLTSIVQTFIRYDYTIKAKFTAYDKAEELETERFEAFLNYLSI